MDRQPKEIGGHAPGRGLFPMFQQFHDVLLRLGLHLHQNLLGTIFGKVGQQVGGSVGIHLLHDVGGLAGIQGLHDCLLNPGFDFLEGLGSGFLIQGLEYCLAFVGG